MKAPCIVFASILLAATASAQAPAFCYEIEAIDGVPYRIDDPDPDDWCKQAHRNPVQALKQLNKSIQTNRRLNKPDRFYFDPKRGAPQNLHVQLLLPEMVAENRAGTAAWEVTRTVQYIEPNPFGLKRTVLVIRDNMAESVPYAGSARDRVGVRHWEIYISEPHGHPTQSSPSGRWNFGYSWALFSCAGYFYSDDDGEAIDSAVDAKENLDAMLQTSWECADA